MICGKKETPKNNIMATLRDLNSHKIEMELNKFKLVFDNNSAEWRCNSNYLFLNIKFPANFQDVALTDKDQKVKDLKRKNEEAEQELKELEKIYLSKMSKILLYSHLVFYYYDLKILKII